MTNASWMHLHQHEVSDSVLMWSKCLLSFESFFKQRNIFLFQLLKRDDWLLFFVIWHCKLNILGFQTGDVTKQDFWRCHYKCWEVLLTIQFKLTLDIKSWTVGRYPRNRVVCNVPTCRVWTFLTNWKKMKKKPQFSFRCCELLKQTCLQMKNTSVIRIIWKMQLSHNNPSHRSFNKC